MTASTVRLPQLSPPVVLSVVIPVYNEVRWVKEVLRRVEASDRLGCNLEIVVVDDGSTDGTKELLEGVVGEHPNMKLLRHERNRGKGAALRCGFAAATGAVVLVQDADLEYDPADYPALLRPILNDAADVVFGARFLGRSHQVLYYWQSVGNWVLTTVSNRFTNMKLSDLSSCYKVFRREVLDAVTLAEEGFEFDAEVTAKVARLRARACEVSISYAARTYAEGKKIGWRDGVRALYCVVRYGISD